jgi:hypothetical protein
MYTKCNKIYQHLPLQNPFIQIGIFGLKTYHLATLGRSFCSIYFKAFNGKFQVCQMFPAIRHHIDYIEIGTPVSNKYYLAQPHGEIYGLVSILWGEIFLNKISRLSVKGVTLTTFCFGNVSLRFCPIFGEKSNFLGC